MSLGPEAAPFSVMCATPLWERAARGFPESTGQDEGISRVARAIRVESGVDTSSIKIGRPPPYLDYNIQPVPTTQHTTSAPIQQPTKQPTKKPTSIPNRNNEVPLPRRLYPPIGSGRLCGSLVGEESIRVILCVLVRLDSPLSFVPSTDED